jgi:hypothetical protein
MARYLGILVYRLLTKGQAWVDRVTQDHLDGLVRDTQRI